MQTHDFHHFFLKKKQLKEKHLLMSVPRKKSIFRVFSLSFLLNMTYNLCLSKKHKNNDARNYRNFKFYLTKVCFFFFYLFSTGQVIICFLLAFGGVGSSDMKKIKFQFFEGIFFFSRRRRENFFRLFQQEHFFKLAFGGGWVSSSNLKKKNSTFSKEFFFSDFDKKKKLLQEFRWGGGLVSSSRSKRKKEMPNMEYLFYCPVFLVSFFFFFGDIKMCKYFFLIPKTYTFAIF